MWFLKLFWPSGYILLFWCAMLGGCAWSFKLLLQASAVPEFATGLVGGAIWAIVFSAVWRAMRQALEAFNEDMKERKAAIGEK